MHYFDSKCLLNWKRFMVMCNEKRVCGHIFEMKNDDNDSCVGADDDDHGHADAHVHASKASEASVASEALMVKHSLRTSNHITLTPLNQT